jgi:lipopolysaccharide export system protein LptA
MKLIQASAIAIAMLLPLGAQAERADAQKPLNMQADDGKADGVSQAYVLTGNVVITRGTMIVKGDRAEVKEAPDGFHTFVLTANPGKLATYRQKRDGGTDLWAEGQAQRIEYDERADVIKLFSKADVRQLEGKKITQEMTGEFISYNNRTEVLTSRNDASGADKPGGGRVSITLQPNRKPAPSTPAAPAPAAGKQ